MKIKLGFLAAILAANVGAAERIIELSWIVNLAREDNSSMTSEEIKEFRLYRDDVMVQTLDRSLSRTSVNEIGCYFMTTVDVEGLESRPSNVVCTGNPPMPVEINMQIIFKMTTQGAVNGDGK